MASSQNPNDRQDNKKSTPTSNITPGEPLWSQKPHEQQSFDQGYDWHEPVSLLQGNVSDGNSLTRFGKFSFKRSQNVIGIDHGTIIDIPILRTEGSAGRFTLLVKMDGGASTGQFGSLNTFVEHGYNYCNVDVDMYTLNVEKGVAWDTTTNTLSVTFEDGETEKVLRTVIPYRTRVRYLLPDVLRKKVTYWIEEYNNVRANNYRNRPYRVDEDLIRGLQKDWDAVFRVSCDSDKQSNSRNIKNHYVWYKVYTLPMPISWIKSNVGQPVYIDRWDKNYKYRVNNNTEREKYMPNREDDATQPDLPTDGYITRWDHLDKMELVIGKTRFTRFANRMGSNGAGISNCTSTNRHPLQYQGHKSYWWISNDTRLTHREWPQWAGNSPSYTAGNAGGGASVIGVLGLKQVNLNYAIKNQTGIVMNNDTSSSSHSRGRNSTFTWFNNGASSIPTSWKQDRTKWQLRHIPLPYTGWSKSDFPADYTLNLIEERSTTEPDGQSWSQDAYRGNDSIHPETPYMFIGGAGGPDGYNWGGKIPYEDQSWYESQRYSCGVDMTPTSKITAPFRGYTNGNPHVMPTPVDREFKYGDPLTRVGNLAQVMFNHQGTDSSEYYQGMTQMVLPASAEDPSKLKLEQDMFGSRWYDTLWDTRRSGHHSGAKFCFHRCYGWWCTRSNWEDSSFWGPVGYGGTSLDDGQCGGLQNATTQWINQTNNMPLCAGLLATHEDAPLSYNATQYFDGYRYDGTSIDTSGGSAASKTGYGSPGHGEQCTSRFLWDYRNMSHPLSSYEKNESNLRGYYRCCTDHVDKKVLIKLEPLEPDPPYNLGSTEVLFLINKDPDYDTFKAAEYDVTVLTDHTINAGPTFRANDEWDKAPTNVSVTERLFTTLGAKPANPVLFLGVSAGNLPGGSMDSRERVVPPAPSRTVVGPPTNVQNYNADKLVDAVIKTDTKTYTYTYQNRGGSESSVYLGVSFQRQQGPYVVIPANGGNPQTATGDKIDDWSYNIITPGYRPADSSFPTSTFLLSAGESVQVEYSVTADTETPTGYIIAQSSTITESSGVVTTKQLIFDVDVS